MSIIGLRAISLSRETKEAWQAAGLVIPRGRIHNPDVYHERIITNRWPYGSAVAVLQLGSTGIFIPDDYEIPVINHHPNIQPLLSPGRMRRHPGLSQYLPKRPEYYPIEAWFKGPGKGGNNKHLDTFANAPQIPSAWDFQIHKEGQEWRVVTVNDKVVQVFTREGPNSARKYKWVGVSNCPNVIKNEAKKYVAALNPGNYVIAWDLIESKDGNIYLLEGNTCPGVNEATATRIVKGIRDFVLKENDA